MTTVGCAAAAHDAVPERVAQLIASDELLTWGVQRCELALWQHFIHAQ